MNKVIYMLVGNDYSWKYTFLAVIVTIIIVSATIVSIKNVLKERKDKLIEDYDISPQLIDEHFKDSSFLGGGSSGSMLVSFDPKFWSYEICGIYWGTWAESSEQRKASFSIFHSNTYSFIPKYVRL